MTPAEEAGLHVGDVILVTKAEKGGTLTQGKEYILQHDDGTPAPWFIQAVQHDYARIDLEDRHRVQPWTFEKCAERDWEIVRKSVPAMTDDNLKLLMQEQHIEQLPSQIEAWRVNGSKEELESIILSLLLCYRELYK